MVPDPEGVADITTRARQFLDEILAAEERQFPSVGHGTDHRYRSVAAPISASQLSAFQRLSITGTALVHQNELIHAAFFRLDDLPSASDKAAALEAALTAELSEDDPGFIYRLLGERPQRLKERKDANDAAAAERLRELEAIAAEKLKLKQEPQRLSLNHPGEHDLFTVLRVHAKSKDENYVADCARKMVAHLRASGVLSPGWSNSKGGLMRVEQSLLAESWNTAYAGLGFDPENPEPPFLKLAVAELAKSDT